MLTNTTVDDNLHSNSKLNHYTISIPKLDILLIGMSYNRDIVKQYQNDDKLLHIADCIDSQTGKKIDPAVARDTYRCHVFKEMFKTSEIYTVNKCEDKLRSCNNEEDQFNISYNVCNRKFPQMLKDKNWTFNEIYVDTFRMQKSYVYDNFTNTFFVNLGVMAREKLLKTVNGIERKVYLPFQPHILTRSTKLRPK